MRKTVLGVDLSERNIRMGMVDLEGNVSRFNSEALVNAEEFKPNKLEEMICSYLAKQSGMPAAVAIGFPATLDRARSRLCSAPNLPGFSNADIVNSLKKRLNDLPIYIDRDAVMQYCGDCFDYQLPRDSIIVACYIGSGLGNVISINGRILYGRNGAAGELGHIPVLGAKGRCVCGNEGCVETLASGQVVRELSRSLYQKEFSTRMFTDHMNHPRIKLMIDGIAAAVATEVNLLDPEFVIMGGWVTRMPDFPRQQMAEKIRFHSRKPGPAENVKILYSRTKPQSGVAGAGLYGFAKLKEHGRL